ncbi:MAG: hypothetical protein HY727_05715 [Candidatus Rokubacteria bacterium]|nr:hypothetical protein [Candidatus Rokubacteria bacterium]
MRTVALPLIVLLSTGCTSLVDSDSKKDSPDVACVQFVEAKREAAAAAAIAPIVLGVLVDQLVKGFEQESKRYNASFTITRGRHELER